MSDIITHRGIFAEDETICPVSESRIRKGLFLTFSLFSRWCGTWELSHLLTLNFTESLKEHISGSRPGLIRDSVAYENVVTDYDAFTGNVFGTFDQTPAYANAQRTQTYAPDAYDATWMIIYAYD